MRAAARKFWAIYALENVFQPSLTLLITKQARHDRWYAAVRAAARKFWAIYALETVFQPSLIQIITKQARNDRWVRNFGAISTPVGIFFHPSLTQIITT